MAKDALHIEKKGEIMERLFEAFEDYLERPLDNVDRKGIELFFDTAVYQMMTFFSQMGREGFDKTAEKDSSEFHEKAEAAARVTNEMSLIPIGLFIGMAVEDE